MRRGAALRVLSAAVNMREEDSYIRQRVLDALLREDVRGCVSQASVADAGQLAGYPGARARPAGAQWLRLPHFQGGVLWIPVQPAHFMQQWRSTAAPLLWQEDVRYTELLTLDEILACFAQGLAPSAQALFRDFAGECKLAAEQRRIADDVRERWFGALRTDTALQRAVGNDKGRDIGRDWQASLLYHDRLAAFHDHPLYPTARAKLGFDAAALEAYGPESQQSFRLRWLALPRELVHASGEPESAWPAAWPRFEDVGLAAHLASSHALLPVHPFVWGEQLNAMLEGCGLAAQALPAPLPWLAVAPTLSVRTVVLLDAPEWHVKVPLTIRTLGAKNIRTIKPSTIRDGHSVQMLLGAIAAREPAYARRLLLTDERAGAHADHRMFLGYILRRYPDAALQGSDVVAIAALAAAAPGGGLVAQELAGRYYGGDLLAFFDDYLDLTLGLHLTLWLRYGVALESNQQNSVLVLRDGEQRLRLLLKDNDAARIYTGELARRWPDLAVHLADLQDSRISVDDELPLAQMFITITLQLNIAALAERYAGALQREPAALYARVRACVERILSRLEAEGEDAALARRVLLEDERLYLKCLLIAATLAEKTETGADDVNKFYGHTAPNFLRMA
ncbi:siderophore biosynthesis protein [Pseudoduganella sp. LjRoot289]|uniref:IucA/IucC family protein n=1 Tax=Pseudoduganella sp. LjRoot289 TaxID=3342314 RepID=UPI003ED1070F